MSDNAETREISEIRTLVSTDPNHVHSYDSEGRMACCSLSEKIETESAISTTDLRKEMGSSKSAMHSYYPSVASASMLITGLVLDQMPAISFFKDYLRITWYCAAYLPVALPVLRDAMKSITKGAIFSEFMLMSIATIGAFAIKQYPEAVSVMLFYSIGELFQSAAMRKAKRSIKTLLDSRPETASVLRDGRIETLATSAIVVGDLLQIKSGERLALDGDLITETATFNTASITGESRPDTKQRGDRIFAGSINLNAVCEIEVKTLFVDSKLSRILQMVQDATSRKSKSQQFISQFAKIYTPVVALLGMAICLLPYLMVEHYIFNDWLYRALVFLVISCPCALVISIPLGYFGGIGLSSRHGILFKGANYLDVMTKVDTIVMDKTGTLTKGAFRVQQVNTEGMNSREFVELVAALEANSTHPIAQAIVEYASKNYAENKTTSVREIAGCGLIGVVNSNLVHAGNTKLMKQNDIPYPPELEDKNETLVVVAIDGKYAGCIIIADALKDEAVSAIQALHALSLTVVILSGDRQSIVSRVASQVGVRLAYGDLFPEDKVRHVQQLKEEGRVIAFVGDGLNDTPVVALADVGIAMGGVGSDATIETADVVIQNDNLEKIAQAIRIGKITRRIVWQNIILAMSVKTLVLVLGAGGLATLWEAVFADVGVALLAIVNAARILRTKLD